MLYNFKNIKPVATASDLTDIILSKVQRKTPTVVHPTYEISRIRRFYMRKVKFAQDCIDEKLEQIIEAFPKIDSLHPFYGDLINVLYDRDHYKIALSQIATCKRLVDTVARDYTRLLKFAESLYRCKQLKKAALGRMVTLMMKQKSTFLYLEQVRTHMGRLPSIDPYSRTLIICGYPNVGKSSFINKVTNANVEVQPYAFTTKSLFVGHLDYRYLRWQVIDTPGILDHPFEERNTIEMLCITALAHLQSCVMYFMDISEQCGYTIEAQCKLFNSIKPLFQNKPTLLVINKIDIAGLDSLDAESRNLIQEIVNSGVEICSMSCLADQNITEVRSKACDMLLEYRVDNKMKSKKITSARDMLHISYPSGNVQGKEEFIPQALKEKKKYDPNDPNRPKLERDLEKENGGCGVYSIDLKKSYLLEKEEWKHDVIPEIIDGKNIADFIDPEIESKLNALEEEEEKLISQKFYEPPQIDATVKALEKVKDEINYKKEMSKQLRTLYKSVNSKQPPGKISRRNSHLRELDDVILNGPKKGQIGFRSSVDRAVLKNREMYGNDSEYMDIDTQDSSQKFNKSLVSAANRISTAAKASSFVSARESRNTNRKLLVKHPKHLFSGKRTLGKTNRR